MKTRRTRRQFNHKGLSLVEVIIAVVILSVVVTATMRLFVSSVGYNVKSRDAQRAITVAESTMESFKAYHLKDLCLQFGAGSGGTPFKGVSSDATTTWSVTAKNGGSTEPALDSENELIPTNTEYVFWIYDAVEENRHYDVKVTVQKAKSEKVLKMDDMNPYRDMVYRLLEVDATDGVAQVTDVAKNEIATLPNPADLLGGGTLTFADVTLTTLQRNIVLTAEHDAAGADTVKLEISYDYDGEYSYTYPSTSGGTGSHTKTVTVPFAGNIEKVFDETTGATSEIIYNNKDTVASVGGTLKNIYLYYYPMYDDAMSGVTSAKDNIKVDCSALSGDIEAHISKQKSTLYSDTALNNYESGYYVNVDLSGNVSLTHNLTENLGGVSTIPVPGISGGSAAPAEELGEGMLEEKGVLYNVEVLVYNAGDTTKELASFVGTMND